MEKKILGRYRKWVETHCVKYGNREEPGKKKNKQLCRHMTGETTVCHQTSDNAAHFQAPALEFAYPTQTVDWPTAPATQPNGFPCTRYC